MVIPLAEPNISDLEKQYVMDALESGWINTTGPYVTKFEELVADIVEAKRAVAVTNGTSGLFLALKAMGVGPGDKVLVPSITFVASINTIRHVGAEPIFFDCDEYLNINVNDLETYFNGGRTAKAIMPVHVFGNPCDMTSINTLAKTYGLKVIEDACEALGSKSNRGFCGNAGDIGVFSFSFNKMITSGNGGMIITDNDDVADKIRYWATQSKDDAFNYVHNEVGYNLGMTNIHAALGYGQAQRIGGFIAAKQQIMNEYKKHLDRSSLFVKPPHAIISNCWFIGYLTTRKQKLIKALQDEGIQTRPLWWPNHLQEPFKEFDRFGKLGNTMYYKDRVINLPCSTNLTSIQIKQVCDIINKVI